jgi:type I restriction enzyme S subunit
MSKKEKTALVPKFRFPEFKYANEWIVKTLGDVTYTVNQKNSEAKLYPIYSINNKEGFLPQSDQFEGVDSHSRGYDISLYKIVDKNTFAYNPARINVGSIGYSGELFNIIISSLYVCFKTNDEIEDNFLQYFLETSSFNNQVSNNSEGGIRNYLFYENFSKIIFQFPQNEEQKKIADCLSSLDKLITAENKKLEALKTHKKGLMQRLFPAEGETVPEWRFAEFGNSGKWEVKKLKEVGEIVTGNTPATNIEEYYNGDYLFVSPSDISDKRYVESTKTTLSKTGFEQTRPIKENSILYVCIGSTIGKIAQNKKRCATNQQINSIMPYDYFSNSYIYYALDCIVKRVIQLAGKQAVPIINKTLFSNVTIPIATNKQEQQKIADCLSALDDLITAQAENIEALKVHKKGLMQALFPSFEEVRE